MGLDSVELIMEFEKTFDIKIPDAVAEKLTTVESVHDWIWDHIEKKHTNKCNSQILFYKLRKYLSDQPGLPKDRITPATSLNDIIPWKNRQKEYDTFENKIKLELPKLSLSGYWQTVLNSFGFVTILGGLVYALSLIIFSNKSAWMLLYPVAGIILTLLFSLSLIPKKIHITPPLLKDFTKKTLVLNYSFFVEKFGTNRKDVEAMINQVIVDKIGVDLEEITPEKSFTDDLGVD
ncbi:MAG TPA: hypothetical protein VGO58_11005 [Chitinophagaceae bacterium]|jgi:acyl carrier protein|nr:hypothetical protein [Chitinophagaceae bacterium]